jgi:hypothetical protein
MVEARKMVQSEEEHNSTKLYLAQTLRCSNQYQYLKSLFVDCKNGPPHNHNAREQGLSVNIN